VPGIKLPLEVSRELKAVSRLVTKNKGALLFRRGAPSRGAYLIRRGQVELSLEGGGTLYPTRLLGPGSIVGLPASFSVEAYSLKANAVKNCELEFISRSQLLKLLRENTTVALQLLQILSEEIAQMRQAANAAFVSSRPQQTIH